MGGYSSGRPVKRAVLEDGLPLDLGKLIREGLIRPGSWAPSLIWRRVQTGEKTASASYIATMNENDRTGVLQLSYRITDRSGEHHDIVELFPASRIPFPAPSAARPNSVSSVQDPRTARQLFQDRHVRRSTVRHALDDLRPANGASGPVRGNRRRISARFVERLSS